MSTPATPAAPAAKKGMSKKTKRGLLIGGIALLLIIGAILIMVYKPFTFQKKSALKSYIAAKGSASDKTALDNFLSKASSSEISDAYTYIMLKQGSKTIPADLQTRITAITTKYGIFS